MYLNSVLSKANNYQEKPLKQMGYPAHRAKSSQGDSVSFKGVPVTKILTALENNPILSLATIDVLGMITPRTLIELNRNKKELGHLNWDAGREMLTNQSLASVGLYLGPGYVFNKVGQKLLDSKLNPLGVNTKAFTNFDTLKAIELKVQDILKTQALAGNKTISVNELRKMVAKGLLEDVRAYSSVADKPLKLSADLIDDVVREVGNTFKHANIDKTASQFARSQLRSEFKTAFEAAKGTLLKEAAAKGIANPDMAALTKEAAKLAKESLKGLTQTTETAVKKSLMANREKGVTAFINKLLPKMTKHLKETEVTLAVKGAKPITTNAGIVVRDVFTATDDVIAKAAKGVDNIGIDKMRGEVDKIIKSTRTLKIAKVVLPFVLVLAFLMLLPKFVVWMTKKITGKEEFPGLAGLSKDSKGNSDKVAFSSTENKAQPAANTATQPLPVPVSTNVNNAPQATNLPNKTPTGWEEFLRRYER
ncbi:MAG: hypothetical protein AB1782_20935 [Cyanobacteriota bacterium]